MRRRKRIRRRRIRTGCRRSHRQNRLRRAHLLSLRALRRRRGPHHQPRAVRRLRRSVGQDVRGAEHGSPGHRPLPHRQLPAQRGRRVRAQLLLPRGPALLRPGCHQGRRRRGLHCARRHGERRGRLRMEPAGGAGAPGRAGGKGPGQRGHRVLQPRGAHRRQPDELGPGVGRRPLRVPGRPESPPVPDLRAHPPGHVDGDRPRPSSRRTSTASRASPPAIW